LEPPREALQGMLEKVQHMVLRSVGQLEQQPAPLQGLLIAIRINFATNWLSKTSGTASFSRGISCKDLRLSWTCRGRADI
jgi:hypothetical protein